MIHFHFQFQFLFLVLFLPSFAQSLTSVCNQTCGQNTVQYPFGFSSGCKIPLTCSSAKIHIGSFSVLNITSDYLLLNVPPSCNRSINSTSTFFGQNYAMNTNSGLFLRNCSSNSTLLQCSILTQFMSNRLDTSACGLKNDSSSCFGNTSSSRDFFTFGEVFATGCSSLFTSVRYQYMQGDNLTANIFSEVELGWWIEGSTCKCSDNARCTHVLLPGTGKPGFRCKCTEGFVGDGFVDGKGCLEVCNSSRSAPSHCKGSSKIALVTGVIVAGASLMAGVAALLYIIRNRTSASRNCKQTKYLLSEASFSVPFYPYKTIEKATGNFSETCQLGTGAYGKVYVGTLSNGELIAVKKIKHPDPETIKQVMNEVKMISSVNHPNLVRLLGCCIDRGEQILVYEFMPNGTLSQHLQRQKGPGLPWAIRLSIAAETAKAVAYLHSAADPPIYHRDIKSSNILLDHKFNAKIADFGLSRSVISELSHISTAPQGTPGYVDPQYHQNYQLSDKSDVYSFGVVLMEIITGLKVVDFDRVQTEINLASMSVDRIAKGRVEEIIDPFLNTQKDSWTFSSILKVAELAFRCLAFHRDLRPSMVEVSDELEHIRIRCWDPEDGEVEFRSLPLIDGDDRILSERKSRRLVLVSGRIEEKADSPVSVHDSWVSNPSSPSSNRLLGDSIHSLSNCN